LDPTFDIASRLVERIDREFVVVARPDHPELLSGPSILVGGRGRLTAIFRVGRQADKRALEAKVIAAKLALPSNSLFVALASPALALPAQLANHAFDFILPDRDISGLLKVCVAKRSERKHGEDLRENQRQHGVFYSTLLRIAELRRAHKLQSTGSKKLVEHFASRLPQIAESDGARRESRFRVPTANVFQTTIAALTSANVRQRNAGMRALWSETFLDDFVLDLGVPYGKARLPRILLVDEWPYRRGDPHKPVRGAAFSGWITALATTEAEIERLLERAVEVTRAKKQ
jgi:hypothetical protein